MGGDRGVVRPATSSRWRRFAGPGGLVAWTLLGVCLVLARQVEHGVRLEFDSANYISAAHNLLSGSSGQPLLLRHDGGIFSAHAPLYPALLAVAGFGVFDPLDVAGPLNAVLFGAMVWICGTFLRRRLAAPVWAQCGCAAIAVNPLLVDTAATAMPTTGIALLTACVLIWTAERDLRWRRVALTAVFSALACLMHYTGVALLAVASIALLLPIGCLGIRQRWARAAVCATVGLAPLGLWLLRNQLLTGTLTGYNEFQVVRDPIRIYQDIGDELTKWVFLELAIDGWLGTGWAALALVAFVVSFAFYVVRRDRVRAEVRRSLLVFGGFVLAHSALLATFTAWVFQTRYLTPVYFPVLAVVWFVVNAFRQTAGPRADGRYVRTAGGSWIAVAIALTWLAYQGAMHKHAIVARNTNGWYYDGPRWRESEVLRHLDAMVANNRVQTNDQASAQVYLYSRVRPERYSCSGAGLGVEDSYLLWLEQVPDHCLLAGRDETFAMSGWDLVADFADGVLLRFNAASDATLADAVWAHFAPSGQPAHQAFWTVHLDGGRLVYRKRPCAATDTAPRFFVHVRARSNEALPPHRRAVGFDSLDFDFADRGLTLPGVSRRCVAFVELPRYPLAGVYTGQFVQEQLWAVQVDFDAEGGAPTLRRRPQPDEF